MSSAIIFEPLVRHRYLLPLVAEWFETEWPDWYGAEGQGNLQQDLQAYSASAERLPVGMIAFERSHPVGAGALKAESIPGHTHLCPWAAAGYVVPSCRGRGIGAALLAGLVRHAETLGFERVFCATSTSESLLIRSGWSVVEVVQHAGKALTIFRSAA